MTPAVRTGLSALLAAIVQGCGPAGFVEGYAAHRPPDLPVADIDRCGLSRPSLRAPAELMLHVETSPYTSSRLAIARAGGVREVDVPTAAVAALDAEAAALANQTIPPLTDLFDAVVPVPALYEPGPGQIFGKLRFEAAPFGQGQIPVVPTAGSYLELHYELVQITAKLRLQRDGKMVEELSAAGIAYQPRKGGLEAAIRESGFLNSAALCHAMRQIGVRLRRSEGFRKLLNPPPAIISAPLQK